MRVLFVIIGVFLSISVSYAKDMRATIYYDGLSCPGNCDAHVVLHADDNGTVNAHVPSTHYKSCKSGEPCEICFSNSSQSCMKVTYRGGGPKAGTFDFTPAFYKKYCNTAGIPSQLQDQCDSLDKQVKHSGYSTRINCFEKPEDPRCKTVMTTARAAKQADAIERNMCLSMGQDAYNHAQTDVKKRRALGCNYSEADVPGHPWKGLMPGACPESALVGRDKLDCCINDLRLASSLHPECSIYFIKP